MFRKNSAKHSSNPILGLFRMILSLIMFGLLSFGVYLAYVQFSGADPLKMDPKALVLSVAKSDEAVKLVDKVFGFQLPKSIVGENSIIPTTLTPKKEENQVKETLFSFMLIADSHNENNYLNRSLIQAKSMKPNLAFAIGLGDYTEVGTIAELQKAKNEFDKNALRYFVIPGDHDLWDARNRQLNPAVNFQEVFGVNYQSFTYQGVKFILIDNSDSYRGISDEQMKWLTTELENTKLAGESLKGILVFLHIPLSHPSSDHVMGRVEKDLKGQAKTLGSLLKEYGVRKVFAGDVHFFTEYVDPENSLSMVTVGALASQRNTQASRFAIVNVYEDGNVGVEDIEIR